MCALYFLEKLVNTVTYLIPSKGKWERVPTTYLGTLIIKAVHSKGPLLTCKSVCHLTQIILLVKQFSMKLTIEIGATQTCSSCAFRSWCQINVQKYFPVSAVVLYIPFTFYPHAYNTFFNLLRYYYYYCQTCFLAKPLYLRVELFLECNIICFSHSWMATLQFLGH